MTLLVPNEKQIGWSLGGIGGQQQIGDALNGFAAVGHNDGSVSIWNLNMR